MTSLQIEIFLSESEKNFILKFQEIYSEVTLPEVSDTKSQWGFGEEFDSCYDLFKIGLIIIDENNTCFLSKVGIKVWELLKCM